MTEVERIKEYYTKRIENRSNYSKPLDMQHVLMMQDIERRVVDILNKNIVINLHQCKILDVGCGDGWTLRNFVKYGARPSNCYGYDLMQQNIADAKERCRDMNLRAANFAESELPDEYFDIILQFTCYCSIKDETMRKQLSEKMIKCLKPTGMIIWFDICNIQGDSHLYSQDVKLDEIKRFFPNLIYDLNLVTIGKYVSPLVGKVARFFPKTTKGNRYLNTHYLGTIRKTKPSEYQKKIGGVLVELAEQLIKQKLGIFRHIIPRWFIDQFLIIQSLPPIYNQLPDGRTSYKQNAKIFWVWEDGKDSQKT